MIELHFPVTPAVGYGVVKIDASNYWMFLHPIVGYTSNYWSKSNCWIGWIGLHPIVGFLLRLIWTNIAKTNVAWINVSVKVGICLKGSKGPFFKVWYKLGH